MSVILKSGILQVTNIKKKTSVEMFKSLHVGDYIFMSVDACPVGRNKGQSYSVYVKCTNITTNEYTLKSFNQLGFLDNFEFDVVG